MKFRPSANALEIAALALAACLVIPGSAGAAEVGMHLSVNLPLGDFEDDHGAEAGFGGGFEVNAALTPNLAWTSSTNLLFNSLEEPDNTPSNVDLGSWVNIPLFTGIRLVSSGSDARGYLQAQAGLNLGSMTESSDGSSSINMDWAVTGGFGLGAGFLVKQFHMGLRFYQMAEAEHTITVSSPGGGGELEGEVNTTILQLLLGVSFEN